MKYLSTLLILLTIPGVAFGELKFVPKWKMSGDLACYDKDGAKELLKLDTSFGELKDKVESKDRIIDELKLNVDDLKKQITALKETKTLLQEQYAILDQKQRECIQKKAQCEGELDSGPSLGWLIAGGLAFMLVGFTVATVTK